MIVTLHRITFPVSAPLLRSRRIEGTASYAGIWVTTFD